MTPKPSLTTSEPFLENVLLSDLRDKQVPRSTGVQNAKSLLLQYSINEEMKEWPFQYFSNYSYRHCIRAPPRGGRYWKIHPRRPRNLEGPFFSSIVQISILDSNGVWHCWFWSHTHPQLKMLVLNVVPRGFE